MKKNFYLDLLLFLSGLVCILTGIILDFHLLHYMGAGSGRASKVSSRAYTRTAVHHDVRPALPHRLALEMGQSCRQETAWQMTPAKENSGL
mgnify:CR=1 FL=1